MMMDSDVANPFLTHQLCHFLQIDENSHDVVRVSDNNRSDQTSKRLSKNRS